MVVVNNVNHVDGVNAHKEDDMLVKYKGFKVEEGVAPFNGVIIMANGCKIKCKGCNCKDLKKLPSKEDYPHHIIDLAHEVSMAYEQDFEGIILSSLEWSEQPLEMLELCKEASKCDLKIMIYTGLDFNEFFQVIGNTVLSSTNPIGFDAIYGEDDKAFFELLGRVTLDTYIPNDYWIKCGRYDRDKPSSGADQFGIELASENQTVYLIKKAEK